MLSATVSRVSASLPLVALRWLHRGDGQERTGPSAISKYAPAPILVSAGNAESRLFQLVPLALAY